MSEERLAVTLYNLRDFTQRPEDISKTLRKVREIGYKAVQLSGLGPIDAGELKRMLDAEGLSVCATHVGWDRLQSDLDTVIEEHYRWECRNVAVGSVPKEYRSADGYGRLAVECSEIGRKLISAGLTFSYHNHYWELEKYDGRTGLEILYENSDPKAVLAEIDTYWIQFGGGDPGSWIRRLKGRQRIVHFKDMGVRDGQQEMFEVGEGNLNWVDILAACNDAGAEWYVVEQDTSPGDPFESIAISLRNLKEMVG